MPTCMKTWRRATPAASSCFRSPICQCLKSGRNCRVYDNQIIENNHENFAPKGNAVAGVPAGTGIMILANRQVEVFDNRVENNQNVGLSICSYVVTGKPYTQDVGYDPYCEAIYVHDNKFVGGGDKPNGVLGKLISMLIGGGKLPAIAYDGVIDPKKAVDGALPDALAIRIRNNPDADFANFDFPHLEINGLEVKKGNISRDLKPYEGEMQPLTPVKIAGVE